MISGVIFKELQTALVAVCSGALITLVYDILRIFRRIAAHGNIWIGIEDFFFWIWTALWVFSVLYRENDGSLRMYTIFAMVMGMFFYHQTISDPLVRWVSKLLRKILDILLYPLKKIKAGIIMMLKWRDVDGDKDESEKKT